MLFSWDTQKAEANLKKHRISFELAQSVFDDPHHLSIVDKKFAHEERWITMGQCLRNNVLVVVHTYRTIENGLEMIRIISARKATNREIKQYETGI